MKALIIKIGIFFLNIIYCFFKILKVQNKVTFISRQHKKKSEDIILLEKELRNNNVKTVVLCKMIESGFLSKIKYFFHMFVQMYYLATSKVIVLDGYCIVACVLKKKKGTTIVQMWHAIGAFKKFGYSILNMEEGVSKDLALAMKMHNNYDYVLTSSKYTKKYFAEAFNTNISKLVVYPLPRVDKLINDEYKKKIQNKVREKYPQLKKKKTIVYAPTFRKYVENKDKIEELINTVDYGKYNLIIKLHPLTNLKLQHDKAIFDKNFSTVEIMTISDYIITDYSAIVFEAAMLLKPIFFYCYDYDNYYKKRNFYIDYKKEMPGVISDNAKEIIKSIESNSYDLEKVGSFSKKYVEINGKSQTKNIVDFLIQILNNSQK